MRKVFSPQLLASGGHIPQPSVSKETHPSHSLAHPTVWSGLNAQGRFRSTLMMTGRKQVFTESLHTLSH